MEGFCAGGLYANVDFFRSLIQIQICSDGILNFPEGGEGRGGVVGYWLLGTDGSWLGTRMSRNRGEAVGFSHPSSLSRAR